MAYKNHYQVTLHITYLKGHTERQKESSKKMQIEMAAINTIKTLALTNGREEIRRSPRRSGGARGDQEALCRSPERSLKICRLVGPM